MATTLPITTTLNKSDTGSLTFSVSWADRLVAVFLVVLLLPVWLANVLVSLFRIQSFVCHEIRCDALGREVSVMKFKSGILLSSLNLLAIVQGKLAFVGVTSGDQLSLAKSAAITEPPGLVSLYSVHKSVGLCDKSHEQLIIEQQAMSTLQRVKLLLRASVSQLIYKHTDAPSPTKFSLFGIGINNVTMKEALRWVCAERTQNQTDIAFFVNVNSFNIASENESFNRVLKCADQIFADGSGVRIAATRAGYTLKDNVNGTDMLPLLCSKLAKAGKSVYLLGAEPGVADQAGKTLTERFPGLKIAGTQHGYLHQHNNEQVINSINSSGCSVLLVAMGSPIQEQWLASNRSQLSIPCALGVGGLFDFYSGNISRAPRWLRELGLEWTWRLIQEPSRMWRRYVIGNPLFLYRTYFKRKELML